MRMKEQGAGTTWRNGKEKDQEHPRPTSARGHCRDERDLLDLAVVLRLLCMNLWVLFSWFPVPCAFLPVADLSSWSALCMPRMPFLSEVSSDSGWGVGQLN